MTILSDTSGKAVVDALAVGRGIRAGGTSGLVLTLVVVADQSAAEEVLEASCVAAAAHPCRLLVVLRDTNSFQPAVSGLSGIPPVHELDTTVVNDTKNHAAVEFMDSSSRNGSTAVPIESAGLAATDYRLDAEVSIDGHLGPGEVVILRMHGRLALHAESVTLPLLAPDVPVVAWWHGQPPRKIARDPLGVFADRRITDCSRAAEPLRALAERAADYIPGDTDVTWSRITPWRALVASAFDTVSAPPSAVRVIGSPEDASTALLCGWLSNQLGAQADALSPATDNGTAGPPVAVSARKAGTAEIYGLEFDFPDGTTLTMRADSDPSDGGTSVLVEQTGSAGRRLPLRQRRLGEQLAEELRHLDPDQPYAAALRTATGIATNLRLQQRIHEWYDPATPGAEEE